MNARILSPKSQKGYILLDDLIISSTFKEKQFQLVSLLKEEKPIGMVNNKLAKPTDFLVGATTLLVVSGKAKKFFEENINYSKIEFIPVILENYNRAIKLWVINILERVKCFDWEKSEYSVFDELSPKGGKMIKEVTNLVFDPISVGNKEIFYSHEFRIAVFISPVLEQKLKESNLIGYEIRSFKSYP